MHNYFYILLACVMSLQVYADVLVAHKIDYTLALINEEMVASTITEKSKIEAYHYNDLSYLAIDHEKLNSLVEKTLQSNLPFLKYDIAYYYYDSTNFSSCQIGNYNCNSVQFKVTLEYQNRNYESEFRYEPVSI